jgi:hypothetical protein
MNEYFIKSDDDILDLADERRAKAAMAADEGWWDKPAPRVFADEYEEAVIRADTEEEMRPPYDEDSDFYDPARVGAPPVWDNPEALPARKPVDRCMKPAPKIQIEVTSNGASLTGRAVGPKPVRAVGHNPDVKVGKR